MSAFPHVCTALPPVHRTAHIVPWDQLQLITAATFILSHSLFIDWMTTPIRPRSLRNSLSRRGSQRDAERSDEFASTALSALQTTLNIANQAINGLPVPGLAVAIGGVLAVVQGIQNTKSNAQDIVALTNTVKKLHESVTLPLRASGPKALNPTLQSRVEALSQELSGIASQARKRSSRAWVVRFLTSSADVGFIQGLNLEIDRAIQNFMAGGVVSLEAEVHGTRKDVKEGVRLTERLLDVSRDTRAQVLSRAQNDLIRDLPRAQARHDSGTRNNATRCFEGTRLNTIKDIDEWLDNTDPSYPRIYWLCGVAGIGKSTVAQTIAEREDGAKQLGASYFFSRDDADRRNPLLVIPTLAFQLASYNVDFRRALAASLEEDPDAPRAAMRSQMQKLLMKPLSACDTSSHPIVIVMDALDECQPESGAEDFLILLASEIRKLETRVKFLITSRPELHIRKRFQSAALRDISKSYILHDIEKSIVQADIDMYFRHSLNEIAERYDMETPWPTQYELSVLVKRAGVFFIYAATAIKFIADDAWGNPDRPLRVLLVRKDNGGQSLYQEINNLYLQVLTHAIASKMDTDEQELSSRFRQIVGAILLVQHPMSSSHIEELLELQPGVVRSTLIKLHSVLLVPDKSDMEIRAFHPSFLDFLTSADRCTDERFYLNPTVCHGQLARICLQHLHTLLREDICDIKDPLKLYDEIPDLDDRRTEALPRHLRYACLHFASHLEHAPVNDRELIQLVVRFCKNNLLMWLEALSLLSGIDNAEPALRNLRQWYLKTRRYSKEVSGLLHDALLLVRQFAGPLKEGAGQVYVTALQYAPRCTLKHHYSTQRAGGVKVLYGEARHWAPCIAVMEGDTRLDHTSASFSPDGRFIVSAGGESGMVLMWNATTGSQTLSIQAHRGYVDNAVFSPDGTRLISWSSSDCTVKIWDTAGGTPLGEMRHKMGVTSALFCDDDIHIVSSDGSGQLHTWDSLKCTLVASRPAHSNRVNRLLSCSTDGRYVSCSDDGTICLWSADGKLIARLLNCDPVKTMAYRASKNTVIFGSRGAYHSWDLASDFSLPMLSNDHTAYEKSLYSEDIDHLPLRIALSPDQRVFARTLPTKNDFSIELGTFKESGFTNLKGHRSTISNLAFSPDGLTLLTTSNDGTMRQWDTMAGAGGPRPSATLSPAPTAACEAFLQNHELLAWNEGNRGILNFVLKHGYEPWSFAAQEVLEREYRGPYIAPVVYVAKAATLQSDDKAVNMVISDDGDIKVVAVKGYFRRIVIWQGSNPEETLDEIADDVALPEWKKEKTIGQGALAISSTTSVLASNHVSPEYREIWLWDLKMRKRLRNLKRTSLPAAGLAFLSDGKRLASFSTSQTSLELYIWDTATGACLISKKHSISFGPALSWFFSGDERLHIMGRRYGVTYDARSLQPVNRLECSKLVQMKPDESGTISPHSLDVRRGWLWESNAKTEKRLCWLPQDVRECISDPEKGAVWVDRYLFLDNKQYTMVLDLDGSSTTRLETDIESLR